jgi:uncharacterized protein (UPF0333 family)
MINLKKLFRRKKGQGALEYLFMVAAALIIIFVVVRYITGAGQEATGQIDLTILQNKAELAKSSMEARGWNLDSYTLVTIKKDENKFEIDSNGDNTADITVSYAKSDYKDDINQLTEADYQRKTIKELYDMCSAGDVGACKIMAALGGS